MTKKLLMLEIVATILYAGSVFMFGFSPVTSPGWIWTTAWSLSVVACPLYILFFYKKRLYSDMIEMSLYVPLNVAGILVSIGLLTDFYKYEPIELSIPVILIEVIIILISSIGFRYLEKYLNNRWSERFPTPATPWLDSITTAASLVATVLLIMGRPETWIYWVVIDLGAIYVYAKNKTWIVMISYILYALNAIRGLILWMGA